MALIELLSNEVIDESIIGFVSLVFMETGDERKEEAARRKARSVFQRANDPSIAEESRSIILNTITKHYPEWVKDIK